MLLIYWLALLFVLNHLHCDGACLLPTDSILWEHKTVFLLNRCVRMAAKLNVDHAEESWPKSAANMDMTRCAMTFKTVDDLKLAYSTCIGTWIVMESASQKCSINFKLCPKKYDNKNRRFYYWKNELKSATTIICQDRRELSPLRTKNNFADEYDAVHESFGYRSILSNMLLKLPFTWGAFETTSQNL